MKLTLQILDAGETFLVPLEDRPLSIGSAADADVQLREDGVAEQHARVEPLPDGTFRFVSVDPDDETRLNGDDVVQARLSVGDRIELGRAVLVVGESRARPRTAQDVVDEGRSPRAAASVGSGGGSGPRVHARRRPAAEPSGSKKWIAIAVGVAAVAAIVALQMVSSGTDKLPSRWGDLVNARRSGRVAAARELIGSFRDGWAGEDAARHARLDTVAADVDAVESALAALEQRVLREAGSVSYSDQLDQLKGMRSNDPDDAGSIAAGVVLSRIEDLRREGLRLARAGQPSGPSEAEGRNADEAGGASEGGRGNGAGEERVADGGAAGSPMDDGVDPTARASSEFVAEQITKIQSARDAGRFNEALETLRFAASSAAGDEDKKALQRVRVSLEQTMRSALDRLIGDAQRRAAEGRDESVVAAITMLEAEQARFPAEGPFGRLPREIQELQEYRQFLAERGAAAVAAGGAQSSARKLSYSEVSAALSEARRADADGAWQDAAARYEVLANTLRDRDPAFAAELDGRSADLRHLVALASWDGDGDSAPQIGVTDEVDAASLAEALRKRKAPAPALVGGAVLAFRLGARGSAEELLARAIRSDRELKEAIDGVLARGRGEALDELGYRLVDGAFVAERDLRVLARAKEIEREVGKLLRQSVERRDEGIEKILAGGPSELDALIVALRRRAEEAAERLNEDAFHDHYDMLAALRTDLDDARRHAKELIYDEVKYFYPYRAPAVSGEKESEYHKVQAEVSARVEAVRTKWDAEVPAKKMSKSLTRSLEQVDWLLGQLAALGEAMPTIEHDVLWARTVPTDEPLTLQNFCWDQREMDALKRGRAVAVLNEARAGDMARGEARQVEITNAYRIMFGHRPLAVDVRLIEAARAHAEEMSTLGYFSHFSPTPGRKSPFDRMKASGYTMGASENIALHSSAQSAHDAWIRSSGHHRNLLAPGHTEFAVGNTGRYWVQNFGRGEDFAKDPAFLGAAK